MAIPNFQQCMLPLLISLADRQVHHWRESLSQVCDHFELSEEEREHLLPSGTQRTIDNRVNWAGSYMKKAELISQPKRGYWQITDAGIQVLQANPDELNMKKLAEISPAYVAWREASASKRDGKAVEQVNVTSEEEMATPQEKIATAYEEIRSSLKDELIQIVMDNTPAFFERLVVDLLVQMGYGGTHGQAMTLGKSGDGGIDGVVMEDRLGLDMFYVQAKRWDPTQTIGRPEIQKFAGALAGQKARRGIFISTAKYSLEAQEYVEHLDTRIILIDGDLLTDLMVDHDLGVSCQETYVIKKVDTDYFAED